MLRVDPPHGRVHRQRVVLDNGVVLRLPPDDIAALGLEPNGDLDAGTLRQLRTRAERTLAENLAYRLLAVRLRSRKELTDRLGRRGISSDTITDLMNDLERYDLLNDARFAGAWVRTRLALSPSGPTRLRYELLKKGVAREVINRALDESLSDQDARARALDLARDRLQRYHKLPKRTVYRRLAGVLARRGFSGEIIAGVLNSLLGSPPQVRD